MGAENVSLKNPIDNPEEWIEQVLAELSPVAPEEEVEEEQELMGEVMDVSDELDLRLAEPAQQPEPPKHAEPQKPAEHAEPENAAPQVLPASATEEPSGVAELPRRREDVIRSEQLRKVALPKGLFAHFLLIDIRAPVREMRGIPRYLRLEACCTVLGRHAGARIFLDDAETVQPLHARMVYEQQKNSGEFMMYPVQDALVLVNGRKIPVEGVVCNNGDAVQIGSAHLIFFAKNMAGASAGQQG